MTKKEMSTESVLADNLESLNLANYYTKIDDQRMRQYKTLAAAFCYPDDMFFAYFPGLVNDKPVLMAEYDRLFRAGLVWLYGAEYLVKNEFQRANLLSDIMGFYTAFGLEPDKERPDSITCELEFMYGLILKRDRARQSSFKDEKKERIDVCLEAEKKFFEQHLEPSSLLIAEKIISQSENSFYVNISKDMLEFLASERKHFDLLTIENGKK
jgi:nitrate reductase assembly molybdenum cofactor insertion protein NarJ